MYLTWSYLILFQVLSFSSQVSWDERASGWWRARMVRMAGNRNLSSKDWRLWCGRLPRPAYAPSGPACASSSRRQLWWRRRAGSSRGPSWGGRGRTDSRTPWTPSRSPSSSTGSGGAVSRTRSARGRRTWGRRARPAPTARSTPGACGGRRRTRRCCTARARSPRRARRRAGAGTRRARSTRARPRGLARRRCRAAAGPCCSHSVSGRACGGCERVTRDTCLPERARPTNNREWTKAKFQERSASPRRRATLHGADLARGASAGRAGGARGDAARGGATRPPRRVGRKCLANFHFRGSGRERARAARGAACPCTLRSARREMQSTRAALQPLRARSRRTAWRYLFCYFFCIP